MMQYQMLTKYWGENEWDLEIVNHDVEWFMHLTNTEL